KAFPFCMAKRVFKKICRRDPVSAEMQALSAMGEKFESSGYRLRWLFEETAIQPGCSPLADTTLKNFREIYESMALVTGINPGENLELRQLFEKVQQQLPAQGRPDELTAPMIRAAANLGAGFCDRMIQKDSAEADPSLRRAHKKVDFLKG